MQWEGEELLCSVGQVWNRHPMWPSKKGLQCFFPLTPHSEFCRSSEGKQGIVWGMEEGDKAGPVCLGSWKGKDWWGRDKWVFCSVSAKLRILKNPVILKGEWPCGFCRICNFETGSYMESCNYERSLNDLVLWGLPV